MKTLHTANYSAVQISSLNFVTYNELIHTAKMLNIFYNIINEAEYELIFMCNIVDFQALCELVGIDFNKADKLLL